MVTLRLRPATLEDALAVASLMVTEDDVRQVAPQETFPVSAAVVERWHRDRESGYVLEGDGRVVAYGEINRDPHDARRFWIGHVVVDPALRSRGLGRHVVSNLAALAARSMRAREVWISAFADNPAALACYLGCGFRESQRRDLMGRRLVDLVLRPPSGGRLLTRAHAAFFGACAAGLTAAILPEEIPSWIPLSVRTAPATLIGVSSLVVGTLSALWQPILPDDRATSTGRVVRPFAYGTIVGVCAGALAAAIFHAGGGVPPEGAGLGPDLIAAMVGGGTTGAIWGLVLLLFAIHRHRGREGRAAGSVAPPTP